MDGQTSLTRTHARSTVHLNVLLATASLTHMAVVYLPLILARANDVRCKHPLGMEIALVQKCCDLTHDTRLREEPTISAVRNTFARMGFNDRETVALILLGHQYGNLKIYCMHGFTHLLKQVNAILMFLVLRVSK